MSIGADRDPIELFGEWYQAAQDCGLREPSAVTLATAGADGRPSARMVLLKAVDAKGFVIYSNFESRKGLQIKENPYAALCFHWMPLGRQVRVEGAVEQVSDAEADTYFASRDRASRVGAWASRQSRPLKSLFELEREVAKFALKFGLGTIPRPPFWSGFLIVPEHIEFWMHRAARLHERLVFHRSHDGWQTERLYP